MIGIRLWQTRTMAGRAFRSSFLLLPIYGAMQLCQDHLLYVARVLVSDDVTLNYQREPAARWSQLFTRKSSSAATTSSQNSGDWVLVRPRPCLDRGSIIVATDPKQSEAGTSVCNQTIHLIRLEVCKRIVGVEGDATSTGILTAGQLWLQGDNVALSRDSRHFGNLRKHPL